MPIKILVVHNSEVGGEILADTLRMWFDEQVRVDLLIETGATGTGTATGRRAELVAEIARLKPSVLIVSPSSVCYTLSKLSLFCEEVRQALPLQPFVCIFSSSDHRIANCRDYGADAWLVTQSSTHFAEQLRHLIPFWFPNVEVRFESLEERAYHDVLDDLLAGLPSTHRERRPILEMMLRVPDPFLRQGAKLLQMLWGFSASSFRGFGGRPWRAPRED